jgi:hypothetical protein
MLPGGSQAAGGRYVFVGGTKQQRHVVTAALEASSFDWNAVPAVITITIQEGIPSEAIPGMIRLDADLLNAGAFAWGVVQHEYAHQVDFFLLDDAQRALLLSLLGGADWCYAVPTLRHSDYGCERFASTLAWSYWPSANNCMRPTSARDESAAMPARAFRALLDALVVLPQVHAPH